MIVPSMTDKEILDHINNDEDVARNFMLHKRKDMIRSMRNIVSIRKKFSSVFKYTSPVSKQEYLIVMFTDSRTRNAGLCYIMSAIVGYGIRKEYISAMYDNNITVITQHFIDRYIERMHLDSETTNENALKMFLSTNTFMPCIYDDNEKSTVRACKDGILLASGDSAYRYTLRTFVSMDMLKNSQRKAVGVMLDKIMNAEKDLKYLYRHSVTKEEHIQITGNYIDSCRDEAEEIYKQYFKKKSYNMVY